MSWTYRPRWSGPARTAEGSADGHRVDLVVEVKDLAWKALRIRSHSA